jgi:hypothetical protein
VTIPTTNKAIAETPANTPKPIGNTCSFFPGKDAAPAFSGVAVGDGDEANDPEERGKGNDEDESRVVDVVPKLSARELVGGPVPPGCEVTTGSGTEETPVLLGAELTSQRRGPAQDTWMIGRT